MRELCAGRGVARKRPAMPPASVSGSTPAVTPIAASPSRNARSASSGAAWSACAPRLTSTACHASAMGGLPTTTSRPAGADHRARSAPITIPASRASRVSGVPSRASCARRTSNSARGRPARATRAMPSSTPSSGSDDGHSSGTAPRESSPCGTLPGFRRPSTSRLPRSVPAGRWQSASSAIRPTRACRRATAGRGARRRAPWFLPRA